MLMGATTLSHEGDDLRWLYILLHVLTHLLACCHEILHLAFELQAPLNEAGYSKRIIRVGHPPSAGLCAPAQQQQRKSAEHTPRFAHADAIIYPRINKTAMSKSASLLYLFSFFSVNKNCYELNLQKLTVKKVKIISRNMPFKNTVALS